MEQILNYQLSNPFALILIAFLLGLITSLGNNKINKLNKNMLLSLIILPALVCAALLAINGELGVSIAIMGVFSLVRFRSVPGTSKDIVSVFSAMVTGLIVSTGYVLTAAIIICILAIITYVCSLVFQNDSSKYELKIVVPESMNFEEIFDEILDKYFENKELNKIKTSNMGSLFEITYIVNPKKDFNKKELIDEIREHNDSLTVAYYKAEKENEIL